MKFILVTFTFYSFTIFNVDAYTQVLPPHPDRRKFFSFFFLFVIRKEQILMDVMMNHLATLKMGLKYLHQENVKQHTATLMELYYSLGSIKKLIYFRNNILLNFSCGARMSYEPNCQEIPKDLSKSYPDCCATQCR